MNKRKKLLALIPALWASLFDTVITIVHQPKEYWNGNLNVGNEANDIGNFMIVDFEIFVLPIANWH